MLHRPVAAIWLEGFSRALKGLQNRFAFARNGGVLKTLCREQCAGDFVMPNDRSILAQAYAVPLHRFGDAARVFWPLAVVSVISSGWFFLRGAQALASFSPLLAHAVPFAIMILHYALAAAGAVHWHRTLVLGEPPRAATLNLDLRGRSYWKRAFFLGLPYFLGVAFFAGVIGALVPEFQGLAMQDNAKSKSLFGFFLATCAALFCVLFVLFSARKALLLPVVALEQRELADKARTRWPGPKGPWRWTLLMADAVDASAHACGSCIAVSRYRCGTDAQSRGVYDARTDAARHRLVAAINDHLALRLARLSQCAVALVSDARTGRGSGDGHERGVADVTRC
jgi:hypothetical protein